VIGMTLCSGIGAPEMAAPWIDWRLASEIEAFPRAVLQHRFGYRTPTGHNQGDPLLWADMTEVTPELLRQRGIPLPEIIVAGTPCQAFSVAGLRQGLEDPRGNLTLAFVEILHAIVAARPDGKLIAVWENVPGVLSDNGNAFGCFLGGLVGAVDALRPPGDGRWPGEGMVQGPRARAAWCILDAQWFGVAQRRRRVFVVVDFGGAVDPAAVLLEPDRLRGDSPPRRETRQGAAAGNAQGAGVGGDEIAFDTYNQDCGPVTHTLRAQSAMGDAIPAIIASMGDVAHCLNTAGAMGRFDRESETFIPVAHALRGEGFDASEDGTGRGTPIVPVVAGTMKSCAQSGGFSNSADHAAAGYMIPVVTPIDMRQASRGATMTNNRREGSSGGAPGTGVGAPGDPSPSLSTSHVPAISFSSKDYGGDALSDLSPTLRAGTHDGSHANAGVPPAIAIQERAVSENPKAGPQGKGYQAELAYTLEARNKVQSVATDWAVRRLTPTECHRLQGFPDDHCDVPWRGKPGAPDGPQYKALGNSMAVPVMRWILDRVRISAAVASQPQSLFDGAAE
jgi:DNA (cytosine-5)-methyltransferase 1